MISELFDPTYYRSLHSDLASLSDEESLNHLLNFGLVEGREFSKWVTPKMIDVYAQWNCGIYPNAEAFNLPESRLKIAFEHLRDFGLNEGRPLRVETDTVIATARSFCGMQLRPEYFNAKYYRQKYPDVSEFNNQELFQHFISFGLNEGRQASSSFDVTSYLENSSDLQQLGFTNQQALEHFIRLGSSEGQRGKRLTFISQDEDVLQRNRVYFSFFYRSQNPDLSSLNNDQLFEHFQELGINEGRVASPYFKVNDYLASNPDLQQAAFTNKHAIQHFITFGFNEIRQTTALIPEEEALKNNLATAPFLGEVQLGFERTFKLTRTAPASRINGVLSNDDSVDYYRLEYLSNPTLQFSELSEQINVKIISVKPFFLPPSLRNPFKFVEEGIKSDTQVLSQISHPLEMTLLPPDAFTVIAELNSTDPNRQSLSIPPERLTQLGVTPESLVLVVEAGNELENSTPYSLIYSYQSLTGPRPRSIEFCSPTPVNLPPKCFDNPLSLPGSTPSLETFEVQTSSDSLADISHSLLVHGGIPSLGELNLLG